MVKAELIQNDRPARVLPGLTEAEMHDFGLTVPPTQDELPYSDGMPMESNQHVLQMYLLIEALKLHWAGRSDVFVGGNMFVYFSAEQVRHQDFRGPDFFAVQGVQPRTRKSWVVWEEGKGPDVVIELLSETTAAIDQNEKKTIYQDRLRVPEYFWFSPVSGEWAGFILHDGVYQPLQPDSAGRLLSRQFQLALVRWEGLYSNEPALWLRWASADGVLLPTAQEVAEQERQHAAQERQHAAQERQHAAQERQHAAQERQEKEAALEKAQRLTAKLRELGIDPDRM